MAPTLPTSVTDLRVNLVGLAVMLATTAAVVAAPIAVDDAGLLLLASVAAPIVLLELVLRRVHRRPSTGIDWSAPGRFDPGRIALRWLGAAGAVGMVLAVYWLAPEYQGRFYRHWNVFLWRVGPPAVVLGALYLAWIDRRLVDPHDGYWHLGRVLTGRTAGADWARIADLLRGWVVKGFFTPLMYVALVSNVNQLRRLVEHRSLDGMAVFDGLWSLAFLVDVTFTVVGYLMTLRVVDGHIRSAEPTMTGWVVALCCYQPFWSLVNQWYLFYGDKADWDLWLAPYPAVKVAYAVVILLLLAIYTGSTVTFGYRFSNLTHRGVLTNGFYRFTKHPAYVSKCTMWWLTVAPFVYRGSAYEVVRDSVCLGGLCFVYFLRARTEERHLSRDPDYVRYALWMNEHGLFAPLARRLPFLRYSPPS
jgi:protein-S-isoprenylcysteine O-methyltransferase Ste14